MRIVASIVLIVLTVILLLSLPLLYGSIYGIVVGSFDWYPREGDVEAGRIIFSIITAFILAIDSVLVIGIVKLIKI